MRSYSVMKTVARSVVIVLCKLRTQCSSQETRQKLLTFDENCTTKLLSEEKLTNGQFFDGLGVMTGGKWGIYMV